MQRENIQQARKGSLCQAAALASSSSPCFSAPRLEKEAPWLCVARSEADELARSPFRAVNSTPPFPSTLCQ